MNKSQFIDPLTAHGRLKVTFFVAVKSFDANIAIVLASLLYMRKTRFQRYMTEL